MKQKIPFNFILDYLHSLEISIKPMFGCHGIYSGKNILMIVRKKEDHTDSNGIWIATTKEHHESLKKILPLQSVAILNNGKKETDWQMIHEDNIGFEESAIRLCSLITQEDTRIGKIPKKKKSKNRPAH